MNHEQIAADDSAVKIARLKKSGRAPAFSFQERNIPQVYVRPRWPKSMGSSVMGIVSGPQKTVHAQSQTGSSWNLPPFTGLWPQGPGGAIAQIMAQRPTPLLDRLTRR